MGALVVTAGMASLVYIESRALRSSCPMALPMAVGHMGQHALRARSRTDLQGCFVFVATNFDGTVDNFSIAATNSRTC
jgi:hypothetical protein